MYVETARLPALTALRRTRDEPGTDASIDASPKHALQPRVDPAPTEALLTTKGSWTARIIVQLYAYGDRR